MTKTVAISRDEAFARLCEKLDALDEIEGATLSDKRTSSTPIRHYWKTTGDDVSKSIVGVEQRGDKSLVAVQIQQLSSQAQQVAYKEYWREFLTQIFEEV